MNKKSGLKYFLFCLLGIILSILAFLLIYFESQNEKTSIDNLTTTTVNSWNNSNIDSSKLSKEILYESKKMQVPVVLFYGEGCSHCEELLSFFDSLSDDMKNKFTLYKYEVWSNNYNKLLMYNVADMLNVKVYGVPYFIIGSSKYFKGYNISMNDDIVNTINELYNNKDFNKIVD